jgi:hypothetical protein
MTRPKTLLPPLLLGAVALLGGCKSGPAQVCDKIDELAAQAAIDGDEASKKMATSMQGESSTCVSRMQTMEQKDPEQFARAASCIEAATEIRGVVQCFFKAAMGKAEFKADAPGKKQ